MCFALHNSIKLQNFHSNYCVKKVFKLLQNAMYDEKKEIGHAFIFFGKINSDISKKNKFYILQNLRRKGSLNPSP